MSMQGDAVQQRLAPFAGQTSLLLFGGLALIAANVAFSPNGYGFIRAVFPSLPSQGATVGRTSVVDLVFQGVMLGALVLVASVSDEGGTLALVFLAALWLLFLYNHRALFAGVVPGAGASGAGAGAAPKG